MSVFGELFGGDQIDAALIDVLDTWMPTYLKEVARQRKLKISFDRPRSIVAVAEFDRWPEEQLPGIVIINPGLSEAPRKEGSGSYRASWPIEVCVSLSAATQAETRRNSQIYITAARGCIMQRRSLGAGMKGIDWGGESYQLIDIDKRRSLAGAKASFVIERENVLTVGAGPTDPDPDPDPDPQPEDWTTVESVETMVDAKPI